MEQKRESKSTECKFLIPESLAMKIKTGANAEGKSFSAFVQRLLKDAVSLRGL